VSIFFSGPSLRPSLPMSGPRDLWGAAQRWTEEAAVAVVTSAREKWSDVSSAPTVKEAQRILVHARKSASEAFTQFEAATGTALPDPRHEEADRLRAKIAALRSDYDKQLTAAQKAAAEQQQKVKDLVQKYEADATVWVDKHEDALQFKYLSQDIVKEAHRQRDMVEELVANEMRQYAVQAKDCAAQLAMVAHLRRLMNAGAPYEKELTGLLAFQRLSSLADAGRETALEPGMVHEQIKARATTGIPSRWQLFDRFEVLHTSAQGFLWRLPDSGFIGRIWQNFTSRVASEDTGILTVRGHLAQGHIGPARDWFRHWTSTHMPKEDPEDSDVPNQMRKFGEDIDAHLRAAELSRYLKAKVLAQQKGLLQ